MVKQPLVLTRMCRNECIGRKVGFVNRCMWPTWMAVVHAGAHGGSDMSGAYSHGDVPTQTHVSSVCVFGTRMRTHALSSESLTSEMMRAQSVVCSTIGGGGEFDAAISVFGGMCVSAPPPLRNSILITYGPSCENTEAIVASGTMVTPSLCMWYWVLSSPNLALSSCSTTVNLSVRLIIQYSMCGLHVVRVISRVSISMRRSCGCMGIDA
jgi:hypothetical protein